MMAVGEHREAMHVVVVIIIRQVDVRCELVDIISTLWGWVPVGFCMPFLKLCFELVFRRSANFGQMVPGLEAGQSLRGCLVPPHRPHLAAEVRVVSQSIDLFFHLRSSRIISILAAENWQCIDNWYQIIK